MKTITKILIFLLITLILAACARQTPQPPVEVMITEQPVEQSVGLEVGNILEVVLPANPSTGYRWEVGLYNHSVLKQVGEPEFIQTSTNLGAEEDQVFHFEAIDTGETELKFEYRQPYEPEAEVQKTFSASVTVTRQKWGFWGRFLSISRRDP